MFALEKQHDPNKSTFRALWEATKDRTFLISAGVAIAISGILCISLMESQNLYRFIVSISGSCACLMICILFCMSQVSPFTDGFFLIVGIGYGFVGITMVIGRATLSGFIKLDSTGSNVGFQLDLIARYMELISLIVGALLARKCFRGWKPIVITITAFTILELIFLFLILWWEVFPKCYSYALTAPTPFYTRNQYAFIALFALVVAMLAVQHKYFTTNVLIYLIIAVILRLIATIFNAIVSDITGTTIILSNLFRIISFLFLFLSVSISTLRNPMETLFRSLNVKHMALQDEKVIVSWMIEQVPTIALLIRNNGALNHVNKYGLKALHWSDEDDLMNLNFFEIFRFEDQSEAKEHFSEFIQSSLSNSDTRSNVLVLRSTAVGDEESRIIEWTFKTMNSTVKEDQIMSLHPSSSNSQTHSRASEFELESMSNKGSSSSRSSSRDIEAGSFDEVSTKKESLVILCLGRDITDKMEREKLLEEARIKAEKVSVMKDTFVANVSHELRTPLNCIVGVTDLLSQMALMESQREMVNMIKTAANSLLVLISDILDFAKLKQGQLKLAYAPIDLRSFVESCIMSISILYSNSLEFGCRISKDCPLVIVNDENRLRQILFNLLSNAIKFTPSGQIIVVVQKSDELLGGSSALQFEVIDSGIGIDETDVPQLFGRFFQADQGENKRPGTGIGLAITKQLVELMGGKVSVTSKLGVGTTIRFLIPTRSESRTIKKTPSKRLEKKTTFVDEKEFENDEPTKEEVIKVAATSSPSSEEEEAKKLVPVSPGEAPHVVLMCLHNQVVLSLLSDSLVLDYQFAASKFSLMSSLNARLHDLASPAKDGQVKKPKAISIVFEVDNVKEINREVLDLLQTQGSRIQLLPVMATTEFQLPAEIEEMEGEFQIDPIRKIIHMSTLTKLLRRGKRRLIQAINDRDNSLKRGDSKQRSSIEKKRISPAMSSDDDFAKQREHEPIVELNILVVEDTKTNQKVMQLMLDRIGHVTYDIVENGQEGVNKFVEKAESKIRYDCILMDLQMPVMDGIAATKEIRRIEQEKPEYGKTHIAALTANAFTEEKDKCYTVGMDDYITKPIGLQTFINKLNSLRALKKGVEQEQGNEK